MIQKLGKYKILDKLGEGAMGSVYRAYDNILDRDVAIKIMADDIKWNPELKLRFYREARSAAGVHHPNIVTIYDLGEEGKTTFIVMEYLQGKNLKQIIQEKPLMPLEKKLAIIAQVADGLNHAHDGGLIHRDIKPANIFVTTLGTAKILDFGIARIPASSLTRVGDRLGTPIYMSPELVRGTNYDARSDIFSAGIVFYEFFTYHHPFREARFDKTLDNILFKKDLPFAEQFPDAPEGLWPILNTCLAKEPENRYANMGEAAQACRALIDRLNLISQQMANQISAVMPNLRLESQKQDAPPSLTRLWAEAQDLLSREQKPDYLSLLRLVNAFNEEPFIQTLAGSAAARREEPAPSPGISPEESKTGAGKPAGEAPVQKPPAAAEAESTARDDISPASSAAQADRDAEIRAPQPQKTPAPPPAPLPQDEATKSEDKLRGAKMLADAEKLLAEDRLEEALDLLRAAIGPLGPVDTLVRKLAETRRKIEARNRTQVSKLLATAKEAVQARQFPNAVEALDKVLELEPGKADATELRRKALAEIESEKAEQMRREEGERNKVTGFKFLAEKKYSESLRMLRQAAEMLGEDETINIGIEESEEGLRAEELHARVLSELMRSHKLFQSGNLNGARTAVHGVLELSPRNEEARELLSRIEKAEQEKNKQAAIASLLRESREAMNQKKFGEALSLANEALGRDPANAEIRNMIQSINQAKEETRRRQEAAELFVKIEESISRQDLDEAESRANSALAVIPNDPVAMEYLKKINLAREEQRKAQEIDNAVSEARQAFQKGDLAQCETVARRILALDPKESRAGDLLNRIAQIRDSKRREKINAVIAQGYTALQAADYQTAAACAKEALQTDAQNEAAEKLLAAIGQAKSDRVQARIAELLSLSRDALSRDQYDKAASLANEILALDAKHKEAKSLIRNIGRAKRKKEKEFRKKQKEIEKASAASAAAEADKTAAGAEKAAVGDETTILRPQSGNRMRRILTWSGAGLICILLLAGGAYWMTRRETVEPPAPKDPIAEINEAKSYLDQKRYDQAIEAAQKVLASFPDDTRAEDILSKAREAKADIDFHMMNAQSLRDQSQFEEALDAVWKVLEINPAYEAAIQVRDQIQNEIDERDKKAGDETRFQRYYANASSLLAACKLEESEAGIDAIRDLQGEQAQKRLEAVRESLNECKLDRAKSEMNRARKVKPGDSKLASLETKLKQKTSELARIEKELDGLSESIAVQIQIADLRGQAESLFKQAKYGECRNILNQWLALAPESSRARELTDRLAEALGGSQAYEDALSAKRPYDALKALERLQKANPSDPAIAGYRQRAETMLKSSKATLTILRKSAPASLMLDGEIVGTGGEVLNRSVTAGPHTLVIQNKRGNERSFSLDFFDGENSTFAYRSETLEFGAMTSADRTIVENRKELEKVNRFMVQRSRGWFLGGHSGELLISGFEVEFVPEDPDDDNLKHSFSDLKLDLDGDKLKFTKISEDGEFGTFKAKNKKRAASIKELWDNLVKLNEQ